MTLRYMIKGFTAATIQAYYVKPHLRYNGTSKYEAM